MNRAIASRVRATFFVSLRFLAFEAVVEGMPCRLRVPCHLPVDAPGMLVTLRLQAATPTSCEITVGTCHRFPPLVAAWFDRRAGISLYFMLRSVRAFIPCPKALLSFFVGGRRSEKGLETPRFSDLECSLNSFDAPYAE